MAPEQGLSGEADQGKTNTTNLSGNINSSQPEIHELTLATNLNWIYKINKKELIEACDKIGIVVTGQRTKDLRKLLSDSIKKERLSGSTQNLFEYFEKEVQKEEDDIIVSITHENLNSIIEPTHAAIPSSSLRQDQTPEPEITQERNNNIAKIQANIQTWQISYRGGDDLYIFLSKVESRADALGVQYDLLIPPISSLLLGPAQTWYEVQGQMIHTWSEFRLEISKFFLPTRFLSYIENLYFARKQRQREKARDYILDLLALAKQHPNLRNRNHLDRLYDNLLPEYRLQFSLDRITSISDLATKCNEYEQLRQEENRGHRHDDRRDDRPNRHVNHTLTGYSRETHCWRCKQAGHNRYKCMNNPVQFCSHCGLNDVLSRSCPCAKALMQKPPAEVACTRQLQFQRIFIQIQIKNVNFRALIDTGASQTFISEATLRALRNEGLKPEPHSEQIQVANQDYVTCKYRLQMPITLNNITTYHSAVVAPNLAESVILGMDFLTMRRFSLTLDNQPIRPLPSRKYHMPVVHGLVSQQNLSHEEQPQIEDFIKTQNQRFSQITGPFNVATHKIQLKHDQPIKQRYYPRNPVMQKVIDKEIDGLLQTDRIEPSKSPCQNSGKRSQS